MYSVLGSVDVRGSICVVMFMPEDRAVGGRKERNSRADRARAEKGLKRVVTSVMKRVIILGCSCPSRFLRGIFWRGRFGRRGVRAARGLLRRAGAEKGRLEMVVMVVWRSRRRCDPKIGVEWL